LSRLFAMLIASVFVLSAFVGIVPAAQAAANALNVSEILKAFDAQGIPLSDGTRAHTDLLAMNPNTPVVAILKLSGDPVAVVKSQMPDMQLSAAQKDASSDNTRSPTMASRSRSRGRSSRASRNSTRS